MSKAIRWVTEAWDSVKEEAIMKCFRKSGITGSSFSVVSRSYEDEDLFDALEAQKELQDLVEELSQKLNAHWKSTSKERMMYLFAQSTVMTGKIAFLLSWVHCK